MKIICNRAALLEHALNVQRAVSTKSTIPAIEGILIKAENNRIYLSGYDLEMGITTSLEGNIKENGGIILPAKLFLDIARRLSGENISVQVDQSHAAVIESGAAEFKIMGYPPEEFPELPSVIGGAAVTVPADIMTSMIRQTIYAVAQTDNKPVHTGTLFEITSESIRLVALDGYRLAMRTETINSDEEIKFVVPGKTLSETAKLLSDDDKPVTLSVGRRHVIFSIGDYAVISRLLDGEFLDYRVSLPKAKASTVKVSTRAFIDGIERASLLINDRIKSPVRCIFNENEIEVTCMTAVGQVHDVIDCSLSGERVEMGFNNKYLLDALRATELDEIRIELNGSVSPMTILPPEGEDFLFIVLPVRLKTDTVAG